MSERAPGSRDWWIETGLVALGGVMLAAWLWDGWPQGSGAPTETRTAPRSLADAIDAGCLTAEDLAALRDRRLTRIQCPETRP